MRGEIERGGSVQLCASLGFLLSTSSSRGQTGIIRLGKLPARPLWCDHGTLVCLFKLWLNSVHSLVKESGHWQIVGRSHREAIHPGRKELRTLPRKWSSLNILMERLWMPHLLQLTNLHEVTSSVINIFPLYRLLSSNCERKKGIWFY